MSLLFNRPWIGRTLKATGWPPVLVGAILGALLITDVVLLVLLMFG